MLNWWLCAEQKKGFGVDWMAGEDRKRGCNRGNGMCACCLITGINTFSGQYWVLVIVTVKPASYQHCSDGDKGNLGRQQKSHHIARFSLFGWYGKNYSDLTENNMNILSCMKSILFSLAYLEVVTIQGSSIIQEPAMKLSRAHVLW